MCIKCELMEAIRVAHQARERLESGTLVDLSGHAEALRKAEDAMSKAFFAFQTILHVFTIADQIEVVEVEVEDAAADQGEPATCGSGKVH